MILEKGDFKYREIITRVCDDCGCQSKKSYGSTIDSRKRRSSVNDYCRKCSYKYRIMPKQLQMEDSPSWRGGLYKNESGYLKKYIGGGKYKYLHRIVVEKHIGRDLIKTEKVHHIDMNKLNNNIDNLHLCSSYKEHSGCHISLQQSGLKFFNKEIWFDRSSCLYVLYPTVNIFPDIECQEIYNKKHYLNRRRKNSSYYKKSTKGGRFLHTLIAEKMIKRKLGSQEVVHHINRDTLNNHPSNLAVMTRSKHILCHHSLEMCAIQLFKKGLIKFEKGKYV